jgi:hypothetical protein
MKRRDADRKPTSASSPPQSSNLAEKHPIFVHRLKGGQKSIFYLYLPPSLNTCYSRIEWLSKTTLP